MSQKSGTTTAEPVVRMFNHVAAESFFLLVDFVLSRFLICPLTLITLLWRLEAPTSPMRCSSRDMYLKRVQSSSIPHICTYPGRKQRAVAAEQGAVVCQPGRWHQRLCNCY